MQRNDVPSEKIERLLEVMARLRSPDGCPWDKVQTHETIASCLLEESAELIEAIERHDDTEMCEELGDMLLQIVFHSQLAKERGVFDFSQVVDGITEKLIRRHPHVFGNSEVKSVAGVWDQWERIKKVEKSGTDHERKSALDGIPVTLNALMQAQKLFKKARKAGLVSEAEMALVAAGDAEMTEEKMGDVLCQMAAIAQAKGWDAESILRKEVRKREADYRAKEQDLAAQNKDRR